MTLGEHRVRLADAGCRAEIYPQRAAFSHLDETLLVVRIFGVQCAIQLDDVHRGFAHETQRASGLVLVHQRSYLIDADASCLRDALLL